MTLIIILLGIITIAFIVAGIKAIKILIDEDTDLT